MTTIKRRPDGSLDESQAMVCSCCGIVLSKSGGAEARALCDYCYGIPKNEGGNFVLFNEADGVPVLNLVVLCRSCNSAKGEIAHTQFFDATTVERVRRHQQTLLSTLLDDERFMGVFRKWYRK